MFLTILTAQQNQGVEFLDIAEKSISLGVIVGGIIFGIFGVLIPKFKRKTEKRKELEEITTPDGKNSLKTSVIYESLSDFMSESSCSRIKICKFHNGGHYIDDSPMKKFSVTHEIVNKNHSLDGAYFQNMKITLFWDLIDLIKQNDATLIDISSLKQYSYTKSYFLNKSICKISVLPIKKDSNITGFIVCEWEKDEKIPENLDKYKYSFSNLAKTIELNLYE